VWNQIQHRLFPVSNGGRGSSQRIVAPHQPTPERPTSRVGATDDSQSAPTSLLGIPVGSPHRHRTENYVGTFPNDEVTTDRVASALQDNFACTSLNRADGSVTNLTPSIYENPVMRSDTEATPDRYSFTLATQPGHLFQGTAQHTIERRPSNDPDHSEYYHVVNGQGVDGEHPVRAAINDAVAPVMWWNQNRVTRANLPTSVDEHRTQRRPPRGYESPWFSE
jgi:hypothetical protein